MQYSHFLGITYFLSEHPYHIVLRDLGACFRMAFHTPDMGPFCEDLLDEATGLYSVAVLTREAKAGKFGGALYRLRVGSNPIWIKDQPQESEAFDLQPLLDTLLLRNGFWNLVEPQRADLKSREIVAVQPRAPRTGNIEGKILLRSRMGLEEFAGEFFPEMGFEGEPELENGVYSAWFLGHRCRLSQGPGPGQFTFELVRRWDDQVEDVSRVLATLVLCTDLQLEAVSIA